MSAPEPVARRTIHPVRPDSVKRPSVGTAGQVLGGKYRLERRIASGGMASVWKATHVTLDRPVAVKFIDAGSESGDEARIERFLREAKVAASVRHKNVVDILDFGVLEHEGVSEPYMIMELLDGEPLDRAITRGPIATEHAVTIARQVLSGLDAVHRAGIVHRDLKPGNVYLSDDADGHFARVLDFGISQDADGASDGTIVGTPEYMSPEQAYAEPLDRRSDLYAVGVILYEMLAGVLPFDDPDPLVVIKKVVEGKPRPLEELRPDVPSLCRVVERAMSMQPEDRFADAREMQRALAEAMGMPDTTGRFSVPSERRVSGEYRRDVPTLDGPDAPTRSERPAAPGVSGEVPISARPRSRAPMAMALLAVVLLAAALAWTVTHPPTPSATPAPSHLDAPQPAPSADPPPAPAPSVVSPAPIEAAAGPEPSAPAPTETSASPDSEASPPSDSAPRAHRRARARASGTIVRELDF